MEQKQLRSCQWNIPKIDYLFCNNRYKIYQNKNIIAGGKDEITDFGDRGINSSIGAQWQDRVKYMDADACKAKNEGKGKDQMNTELKRCKK